MDRIQPSEGWDAGSIPAEGTTKMNFYIELFQKIPVSVLLLLSAASVISGDYFAKFWSTNRKPLFLAIALVSYLFSGVFYIPTLLRQGLVTTSVIWSILGIVGFVFIGLVIFKETLTGTQILGVVVGSIALVILSYSLK